MRTKDPNMMEKIETFISGYYLEHNLMPSTRKIAANMGIANGTAHKYLVAMSERGMLKYEDGKIIMNPERKLDPDREEASALGSIVCGEPELEESSLLFKTSLPTAVFGKGPFYILYAQGDSMVDAGIDEGDVLVIRKTNEARKGDIIVALDENNENTLKCFGGIDAETGKAKLLYMNKAVYGKKVILVSRLVCQGVLSHVIKKRERITGGDLD